MNVRAKRSAVVTEILLLCLLLLLTLGPRYAAAAVAFATLTARLVRR